RSNLLSCSHRIGLSEVRYHGFGYDKLSHDYKVVINRSELPTIIYSLKTVGHFPCGSVLNDAKFTNGTLHWATGDESSSHSWKIVSLDLASETRNVYVLADYHNPIERTPWHSSISSTYIIETRMNNSSNNDATIINLEINMSDNAN
ncbi:hypothetical protein Tco_0707767, partial [Tanacetum coccineum]